MTAENTPPSILIGGPESERLLLKTYLERNRLSVVAAVPTYEESLPAVLGNPEAIVILVRPVDLKAAGEWVSGRRTQGFNGRVGVIVEPPAVPGLVARGGRWNDFVLKVPVAEPDLCGAVRSSSRLADRV